MMFFGPGVKPQALPHLAKLSPTSAQTLANHLGVKPLSNGTALL